ncbi:MAG: hypothetical protein ACFFB7_07195 [Candidatus Sifarchaeia archaeon]
MSLEEYRLCEKCGGTARHMGLERTPGGMRKKFRCSSCGWEFYG